MANNPDVDESGRPNYTPAEEAELEAIAAKWGHDNLRHAEEITKLQLRRSRKIADAAYKEFHPFAQFGCLYWLAILLGGVAGFIIAVLIGWMFWNPAVGFILAAFLGVWVGFGFAYHWVDGNWSSRQRGPRY